MLRFLLFFFFSQASLRNWAKAISSSDLIKQAKTGQPKNLGRLLLPAGWIYSLRLAGRISSDGTRLMKKSTVRWAEKSAG